MKTISAKLTDEEFEALKNWCALHATNVSETTANLVRQLLDKKMELRPTGMESRLPICPECGYLLFPHFGQGTLNCLKCGFYAEASGPSEWHRGKFEIMKK